MGKFITNEILSMPESYIRESYRLREPTVLIIGPGQFLRGIKKELKENLDYYEEEAVNDENINKLDGYLMLAKNLNSRLGWRIILHCDPCDNAEKIIRLALVEGIDINIPSSNYKKKHTELANLIKKILNEETLNIFEQTMIEEAIGLSLEEIGSYLKIDEDKRPPTQEILQEEDLPRILCTSFEGSKGLSAQYVFIVGVNEGHFPYKTNPISNRDICKLIVALTRTRKKCYIISCNRFGDQKLNPSLFLEWLKNNLSKEIYVNKEYIDKYCKN